MPMTQEGVRPDGMRVRFEGGDPLQRRLRARVERYLRMTGRSERDCTSMYVKTFVIFGWAIASYVALVFFSTAWWQAVPLASGVHLKSSVNVAGENVLLVTSDFADHALFERYDRIVVDEAERYAANLLLVGETLIVPAGFPGTRRKLGALGTDIIELDMSEMEKMDGGLTCLSLRF